MAESETRQESRASGTADTKENALIDDRGASIRAGTLPQCSTCEWRSEPGPRTVQHSVNTWVTFYAGDVYCYRARRIKPLDGNCDENEARTED
jgi:hypothetical protein